MTDPKPVNFRAMADAWDDPIRYAAELARYYQQLEQDGHRARARAFIKEDA